MKINGVMPAFAGMQKSIQNKKENNQASFGFKASVQDTVTLSNEAALKLIGLNLTGGKNKISPKEAQGIVNKIAEACKKHGVQPKDLPIDKNHKGTKKAGAVVAEIFNEPVNMAKNLIWKNEKFPALTAKH